MTTAQTFQPGYRLIDGNDLNNALAVDGGSYAAGIIAAAGGGQANATLLANSYNSVDTVVTANDSVKLPPSKPGTCITIINTTANTAQVFGSGTDTINAVAYATGVSHPAGKVASYFCASLGKWFRQLSA